jgi:hypothetical protein
MDFDIDSGTILYGLGVAFAIAAFLYFVRDVVLGLSITVKAALLLFAFVAFFLAGLTVERDVLDVVAYALSAGAYVTFLGYVVVRYDPGETLVFLLLALSAALFVGLGYGLREGGLDVSRRTVGYAAIGLAAASVVLVGADALGGGVTYELELNESVTVDPPQAGDDRHRHELEVLVGTVTVTNEGLFTRPIDGPGLDSCLVGGDNRTDDLFVEYHFQPSGPIRGGETERFDVTLTARLPPNETEPQTYTLERGSDCSVTRDSPTVIVDIEG